MRLTPVEKNVHKGVFDFSFVAGFRADFLRRSSATKS